MGNPGKQRGRHECRKEWLWVARRKSGSAEAGLNGVSRAICESSQPETAEIDLAFAVNH